MSSTGLNSGPVGNPPDINYILWTQIYIRSGCPLHVYPVDNMYPVGDILWTTYYILWVSIFILWIYPVENMHLSYILWRTYPVENVVHRISPQDILHIISCGYILWVSVSFTDVPHTIILLTTPLT